MLSRFRFSLKVNRSHTKLLNLTKVCCRFVSEDPYSKFYNTEGVGNLLEIKSFQNLVEKLNKNTCSPLSNSKYNSLESVDMSPNDFLLLFDACIVTYCIHIESRLSAYNGVGFYTIGPCGEEALSPIGLLLKSTDPMALHYRHLAAQLARQMKNELKLSSLVSHFLIYKLQTFYLLL